MAVYYIVLFIIIVYLKSIFTAVKSSLKIADNKQNYSNNFDSKKFERFISTANIANILLVLLAGVVISERFDDLIVNFLISKGLNINQSIIRLIVLVFLMIVSTYFIVLFGRVIPKKLARKNYEKYNKRYIPLLKAAYFIISPLLFLINLTGRFFSVIVGNSISLEDEYITQEEILMMINAGEETGTIDLDEKQMITNVFKFDNKTAGEIATHRKDIIAVEINTNVDEILNLILEEKYSRIPVYEDNIDNIIGIMHVKDVLKYLLKYGRNNFNLNKVIMEPFFVPFSKKNDELFQEMQKKKVHMSIVIDEYGGTLGIVSMEDIIEEIMGEIFDEYDTEEIPDIYSEDNNSYLIDGTTDLEDVADTLKINLPVDEYDTLSGFMIGKIGRIPEEQEHTEFDYSGYHFKIEKTEEKRISLVKVEKL